MRRQWAIGLVPSAGPVEGSGQRKCRHLDVDRRDGFVFDSLRNHLAQRIVDFALKVAILGQALRCQSFRPSTHKTSSEIIHVDFNEPAQKLGQAIPARAPFPACIFRRLEQLLQAYSDALEQHLVLVGEIMINGPLRYPQAGGDIVKRRCVEAALIEHAHGGAKHGLPFGITVCLPLGRGTKWGGSFHALSRYLAKSALTGNRRKRNTLMSV